MNSSKFAMSSKVLTFDDMANSIYGVTLLKTRKDLTIDLDNMAVHDVDDFNELDQLGVVTHIVESLTRIIMCVTAGYSSQRTIEDIKLFVQNNNLASVLVEENGKTISKNVVGFDEIIALLMVGQGFKTNGYSYEIVATSEQEFAEKGKFDLTHKVGVVKTNDEYLVCCVNKNSGTVSKRFSSFLEAVQHVSKLDYVTQETKSFVSYIHQTGVGENFFMDYALAGKGSVGNLDHRELWLEVAKVFGKEYVKQVVFVQKMIR